APARVLHRVDDQAVERRSAGRAAMTGRSIAVVGAGIIGCLIARELAARDPDAMITVLDRDLIGSGVTRRSAGVSLVKGGIPRTRQMSAFSHAYYAALRATLPGLPIYPVDARLV